MGFITFMNFQKKFQESFPINDCINVIEYLSALVSNYFFNSSSNHFRDIKRFSWLTMALNAGKFVFSGVLLGTITSQSHSLWTLFAFVWLPSLLPTPRWLSICHWIIQRRSGVACVNQMHTQQIRYHDSTLSRRRLDCCCH